MILKIFIIATLMVSTTSCYRMPTDEDYCVIPTTNNPDITGERRNPFTPSIPFTPGVKSK